jgi:asparagine synthase (glutamine-hydrolysing)
LLLTGDAAAFAGDAEVFGFHRAILARTAALPPLSRLLATDLCTFLPYLNLENMDKTGMANGVELRVPFLDHRLVEFSMRLPDGDKLRRGGERKALLRRAWEGRIPDAILRRPKTGYSPPVRGWMRETHRDYARDILFSARARERGYIDPGEVARLFDENDRGRVDNSMRLWTLLVLESWMREYADRTEWTTEADPAALPLLRHGDAP